MNPVVQVALYSLVTALFTWLGALPFVWKKNFSKKRIAWANAVAASLMITASFGLIYEWMRLQEGELLVDVLYFQQTFLWVSWAIRWVVWWILLWLLFIVYCDKVLSKYDNISVHHLKWADAKKVLLIIWIMTLHSFTEGIAVWVSFWPSESFWIFIALAIALHNIPEWLAISTVLVPKWYTWWQAAWRSVFSSLPQVIMAVPAFLFVQQFAPFLPVGLWFAAWAMIWMAISELLPDALENWPKELMATIVTLWVTAMILFQQLIW